jgi:hypothetical protein
VLDVEGDRGGARRGRRRADHAGRGNPEDAAQVGGGDAAVAVAATQEAPGTSRHRHAGTVQGDHVGQHRAAGEGHARPAPPVRLRRVGVHRRHARGHAAGHELTCPPGTRQHDRIGQLVELAAEGARRVLAAGQHLGPAELPGGDVEVGDVHVLRAGTLRRGERSGTAPAGRQVQEELAAGGVVGGAGRRDHVAGRAGRVLRRDDTSRGCRRRVLDRVDGQRGARHRLDHGVAGLEVCERVDLHRVGLGVVAGGGDHQETVVHRVDAQQSRRTAGQQGRVDVRVAERLRGARRHRAQVVRERSRRAAGGEHDERTGDLVHVGVEVHHVRLGARADRDGAHLHDAAARRRARCRHRRRSTQGESGRAGTHRETGARRRRQTDRHSPCSP